MKQLYNLILLTALMAFVTSTNAQNAATPNPGFENWTQVGNHFDPDNWNNLNSQTAITGVFTCTRATGADVHSGTYAIKLTTKSVFTITANGIASTATLITTPPYGVTGGIPYTQRPDSIVGWYKCTPAAADSGFIQFVLLGATNDTIGFVRYFTPNVPVSTFTRFSAPIDYFSAATPVLSYWILSSSGPSNPVVSSSIIIDDIDLIFNPNNLPEAASAENFHITGNVIDDFAELENNSGKTAELFIYDSSGRLAVRYELPPGYSKLDMQQLTPGVYVFKAQLTGNTGTSFGKLIKL